MSGATGSTGREVFEPGRVVWMAVDAVALLALLALVGLSFLPVYGTGWLFVAVLGCGLVGIGVAVLGWWRRLRPLTLAGVAALAWFLLGGPLMMPSSTIALVIPGPRTLFGLLAGPVTAWRDMLTLAPPIGETFNLLTIPGLVGLLVGVISMSISLRGTRAALAWIPPAAGYLVGVLVGSHAVYQPYLVGVAFFLIVLLWTSYRRAVIRGQLVGQSGRPKPVRAGLGAATLVGAGLVGAMLAPALAGVAHRDNVRDAVVPPVDMEQFASPLQGFRANITQFEDTALFDITGVHSDDVVRVATLDKYDGLSYRVATKEDKALEATTFTRVGQWIHDDAVGSERDIEVRVRGYRGVWTPTTGRTTSIAFQGDRGIALGENFFYSRSSGTGFTAAGLREGDSYRLGATVPQPPADDIIATASAGHFPLPEVSGVPDRLMNQAHRWTGSDKSDGQKALSIEKHLRQGYFSHGRRDKGEAASLPGHSERRLTTLLEDPSRMVGDHEQFAVAMALMARGLGIPARVIYGYQAGDSSGITGAQVGAWPELYFKELGWVRFDPTPDKDRVVKDDEPRPKESPLPQVPNPPPPPMRPEAPLPDEHLPIDPGDPPAREDRIDWAQIGALAALTGIPLLTIVVPIVLILGLKIRRRLHRRNDPVIANRIAGAWAELVDRARDVGRSPSVAATRTEQAETLIRDFARLDEVADPIGLAREADWIVFAPGEPSQRTVNEYWTSSSAIRRGMRRSVSWFKWALSHLSTKSFRRIR